MCVAVPPTVCPTCRPFLYFLKCNLSSGVGSIQVSNTQDAVVPRQHMLSFLIATIHGPSQETENAICLGSSTGSVI